MTSDRTAKRLTRLLAMLPWVIAHPGSTVDEVSDRFGYAKRADLMKDLELVFLCGLPGYGPGELMDATVLGDEVIVEDADYFSNPLRLTAAEALVLLAAGNAILASTSAPPALAAAVAKLHSVVSPDESSLTVDLGPEPDRAEMLREAVRRGTVVELEYTGLATGATTIRSVEPWAVFSSLGNWYLHGHCRLAGEERLFRLDRIRRAEPIDETFAVEGSRGSAEAVYSPSADDVHSIIELSPVAAWVPDYYPVTVIEEGDGSMAVDFAASDPAVAARLLIRLGPDASLRDGAEVGEALTDLRRRIIARYE